MTSKLAITSLIAALSNGIYSYPTASIQEIRWHTCQKNYTVPTSCGTVTVPLDYTDPDCSKTLDLSLVKITAPKQPSKGSILLNPGGPGEDTISFVTGTSEPLLVGSGGSYDLIAFNVRGNLDTLPFLCYKNESDRAVARAKIPGTTNTSDTSLGTYWATGQIGSKACYDNARGTGELIGTAFVARDMMQIVDALHEDGLLRYWGFSYGTILGMTVSAMFPDRMDRVVLDGVQNPHQYYAGRDIEQLHDSDSVLSEFFKGCVAAPPSMCPLAYANATASGLEQQFLDLLENVKYNPVATETGLIIDYGALKTFLANMLYTPNIWSQGSVALYGLLHGNTTAFTQLATALFSGSAANFAELDLGIRCGDNAIRAQNLSEVMPIVDAMYNASFALGDVQAGFPMTCATWKFHAKERYTGGFDNVKTKYPVLFVGNTYDPATPLVSAKNASAGFEGSVVLQHDGHGHTSLWQPSLCTMKAVRAYFVEGILPVKGTKCEPSVKLFSNDTTDPYAPIANFTKRAFDENDDDMLLGVIKQLSGRIGRVRMNRAFLS
ncbi:TAP-like protein-domain-containing protein [Xylogone sp. PMI_703]|nr:TAP-like protein-domain-containing protein [Xylogone sp. PMI_703]